MQTRSHHSHRIHDHAHSCPAVPCAQCGRTLFGPEWSEYVNDHKVRHLWVCTACNYDFETTVVFPVTPDAEEENARKSA